MDSVGAERAGLEKDLAEVNSELRAVRERLGDEAFIAKAKPELVEEQRRLLVQLEERRARIELNLAHVEERRPGGIPSSQAGTWSPLVLHEATPVATHFLDEPLPSSPRTDAPVAKRTRSPEWLSQLIGHLVMENRGDKKTIRELAHAILLAGEHIPSLRLLVAALEGYGRHRLATDLRIKIEGITGEAEDSFRAPVESTPAPYEPPPAQELPDPRDGLTRLQRIVLSAMYALWFRADAPMKKTAVLIEELQLSAASITADQVNATLSQLMHPWSRRNPLVDVAGPLCRLSSLAEELFTDFDTLEFEPAFSLKIPKLLAAPIPLLLAKGTDGIPPHHLGELILAALHRLQFPHSYLGELNALLSGPDFPTGGTLCSFPWELYEGLAGPVTVRARIELQTERSSKKARFLISEIPWPLECAQVVRGLERLELRDVVGITDGHDHVIVELDHVAYASSVGEVLKVSQTLRQTSRAELRISVGGEAANVRLDKLIDHFLNHRRAVVTRRLQKELAGLKTRAQELEGLLAVAQVLEPLTKVITYADDAAEEFWGVLHLTSPELTSRVSFARLTPLEPKRLQEIFERLHARLKAEVPDASTHPPATTFSEVQARAILATRRLSTIPADALFREWAGLAPRIAQLELPLRDPSVLNDLVHRELAEQKERHSSPRRTFWR